MTLSNTQADQAEEIKTLVAESDAAHLTSIEKALEAGHRLVTAKADCLHGTWLPFLERAGVQERKAQRLMTLARSGLKSVTVSEMGGIKKALQFLSRRTLPAQGKCLEITAKAAGVITAIGALWPSVEHPGFYYCAVMQHSGGEEGSAYQSVAWQSHRNRRGNRQAYGGEGLRANAVEKGRQGGALG